MQRIDLCGCGCGVLAISNRPPGVAIYKVGHRPLPPDGYRHVLTGYRKTEPLHRVIAARALGRPLPATAIVHHANGDKHDNASSNLVICENADYHALLHRRMRVVRAGGNPNTQTICSRCKALILNRAMAKYGQVCRPCDVKRVRLRRQRRRADLGAKPRRTQCKYGHQYDAVSARGFNRCKTCERLQKAARARRRMRATARAAGTSSSRRRIHQPFARPDALRDQFTQHRLKALSHKQGLRVRMWADGDFDE
jgi:hypothetical protein